MIGYVNVDSDPGCEPDVLHDLEVFPFPFEDSVAEEIGMVHMLEHIAPDPKNYLKFWQEIYRICKNDAKIIIEVPYWKHENFFHDPTHVRAITPITLAMMDQVRNQKDMINGGKETKLGLKLNIDFELLDVRHATDALNGTTFTCHYLLRCVKPGRIKP